MKQIYLSLILSIIFSSALFAQVENFSNVRQIPKSAFNKQELLMPKEKVSVKSLLQSYPKDAKNVTGALQDMKTFNFLKSSPKMKAPAAALQVIYPTPPGAYLAGFFEEDGNLWNYVPMIMAPALRDVEFYPFSSDPGNTKITWTMNNGAIDLSPNVNEQSVLIFNNLPNTVSYMPELHGTSNGVSATYSYGSFDSDGNPVSGNKYLFASIADKLPLTNANLYDGGYWGGWTQTQYFGTGAQYNSKQQNGVLNLFQKPLAPLYVKDIDFFIYNSGGSIANSIPAGKSLDIYIYSVDDTGRATGIIASTTVTKDNVLPLSKEPSMGFIHASFDEIDDIGLITPRTLLLNTAFIVEISGYDASYSFRFILAENIVGLGSAYAIYGDEEIIAFGDPNDPDYNGCDLYVQLNGAYNCLEFEKGHDMLEVDTEGGNAVFYNEADDEYYYGGILYSSLPAEELSFQTPDWLTIKDISTSDYDQYSVIYVTVEGDALPANLTGRADNIIITSEGISKKIYVKQGDADWKFGTGIPAIKPAAVAAKAVRNGDSFQLTYPQGTTSVAVYTVTGQKVAEYQLNAKGTTSIPAGNWSKGVYVLKFAGKTNGTVKVIK